MSDIEYIKKRIEEIYCGCVDEVHFTIREYEKTYSLTVTLKGVNYKQRQFEIDKNIQSVGEIINKICKELD